MMRASMNNAPLEIVHEILDLVIFVPLFLDPDGIEAFPNAFSCNIIRRKTAWDDEKAYWESERYRSVCRRVCRSWDAYLRRFDNRFIRFEDYKHGRISSKVLFKALRISVNCPLKDSGELDSEEEAVWSLDNREGKVLYSLLSTVLQTTGSKMKVQILTISGFPTSLGEIQLPPNALPNLVTLINIDLRISNPFILPNLRYFCIFIPRHIRELHSLHTLQSLELSLSNFVDDQQATWSWELPKLEALEISSVAYDSPVSRKILGSFGGTLKMLRLGTKDYSPAKAWVWEACPRLQCITAHPYSLRQAHQNQDYSDEEEETEEDSDPENQGCFEMGDSPPRGHPINTLYFTVRAFMDILPKELNKMWSDWSWLKTVIVTCLWEEIPVSSLSRREAEWRSHGVMCRDDKSRWLHEFLDHMDISGVPSKKAIQ